MDRAILRRMQEVEYSIGVIQGRLNSRSEISRSELSSFLSEMDWLLRAYRHLLRIYEVEAKVEVEVEAKNDLTETEVVI